MFYHFGSRNSKLFLKVKYVLYSGKTVSCGTHKADKCADCPDVIGSEWCSGDCKWNDTDDTCVPAGKS